MKIRTGIALVLLLAASAGRTAAVPESQDTQTSTQGSNAPIVAAATESRWQLGVALGYGMRSNPLIQADDIPLVVDIDIAWFGDHFFFDNGDFGLTFADNDAITASIVARANSDRVFFGRTNTRFVDVSAVGEPLATTTELTIPDRDYAIEMGVELLAGGLWGDLQLTAHHDVSGTHEGYEIEFDYSRGFRSQRWYFEPSIGLRYKSAELNNYYWGVASPESNDALPTYIAEAGTNVHGRLLFSYQLSQNWAFSVAGEFERLNDGAASSPIVRKQTIFGYFAGFGYRF